MRPIPEQIRMDARFCSAQCRAHVYQRGLRLGFPPPVLTPELIEFRDHLLMHTPDNFVGYRLGITELDPEVIWYPKLGGKTRRYDGSFWDTPYFSLRPFEPPRVPRATIYMIALINRFGELQGIPEALSAGVYVPVASRMCLPGKTNAERKRRRTW